MTTMIDKTHTPVKMDNTVSPNANQISERLKHTCTDKRLANWIHTILTNLPPKLAWFTLRCCRFCTVGADAIGHEDRGRVLELLDDTGLPAWVIFTPRGMTIAQAVRILPCGISLAWVRCNNPHLSRRRAMGEADKLLANCVNLDEMLCSIWLA